MAQGVPYNVFSGPGTISHANCIQFPHLAVADLRFTLRVDLKLFYRGFLLHPASQLYCGAGGAFGPSGEANGDT